MPAPIWAYSEAGGAGSDLGILDGSVLELEAEVLRVEGERLVEIRDDKHDIVQDFELHPCISFTQYLPSAA